MTDPILYFSVKGTPVPKPRMSQRDRWQHRPAVARYREYVDEIRAGGVDAKRAAHLGDFFHLAGPLRVSMTFTSTETYLTVARAELPYRRPPGLRFDLDNGVKAVLEALQPQHGILSASILKDDNQVVALEAAFLDPDHMQAVL